MSMVLVWGIMAITEEKQDVFSSDKTVKIAALKSRKTSLQKHCIFPEVRGKQDVFLAAKTGCFGSLDPRNLEG